MCMVQDDDKAVSSLQYRLMPKKEVQSVDFITSPDENIFSKPNPFLDDDEKPAKTVADNYLD